MVDRQEAQLGPRTRGGDFRFSRLASAPVRWFAGTDSLFRLAAIVQSNRFWSTVASLAQRASSFVAAFVLARWAGAAALGHYSAVVATAGVTVPFIGILCNSATVAVNQTLRDGADGSAWSVTEAFTTAAFALVAVCGLAFVILSYFAEGIEAAATLMALGLAAGMINILRQVMTAVHRGVLYAFGMFRRVGAAIAISAFLAILLGVPAVIRFGLSGAFGALMGSDLLCTIVLAIVVHRALRERVKKTLSRVPNGVVKRLFRDTPAVAAHSVTAAAAWLTTVYFVGHWHGAAGIGVLGIGTQWTNILMLTVVSWGGVTVKAIADAMADSSKGALRRTILELLRKNLGITAIGSLGVLLAADFFANACHLHGTPLAAVLRWNALSAMFLATSNVFERVLYCEGRQTFLLRASLIATAIQVVASIGLTPLGVEYAAIALLVGNASLALIFAFASRDAVRMRHG